MFCLFIILFHVKPLNFYLSYGIHFIRKIVRIHRTHSFIIVPTPCPIERRYIYVRLLNSHFIVLQMVNEDLFGLSLFSQFIYKHILMLVGNCRGTVRPN